MDDEYIVSQQVVERYVNDQLAQDELEAFEQRLIWCEETQQAVEDARLLKASLYVVSKAESEPSVASTEGEPPSDRSLMERFAGLFVSPIYAAGAAAAAVMGATLLVTSMVDPVADSQNLLAGAIVFDEFRSAGGDPLNDAMELSQSSFGDLITLVIFPNQLAGPRVSVNLERLATDTEQRIWTSIWRTTASPGDQPALSAVVSSSLLTPGSYRLGIASSVQREGGFADVTYFKVVE